MPILQYKCKKCGNEFEELVKNSLQSVCCPKCKSQTERCYSGKMFSATGVATKKCSGNCKTCGGCH